MPTLAQYIRSNSKSPPRIPSDPEAREDAEDLVREGVIQPKRHLPKQPPNTSAQPKLRRMSMVQPRLGALVEHINNLKG